MANTTNTNTTTPTSAAHRLANTPVPGPFGVPLPLLLVAPVAGNSVVASPGSAGTVSTFEARVSSATVGPTLGPATGPAMGSLRVGGPSARGAPAGWSPSPAAPGGSGGPASTSTPAPTPPATVSAGSPGWPPSAPPPPRVAGSAFGSALTECSVQDPPSHQRHWPGDPGSAYQPGSRCLATTELRYALLPRTWWLSGLRPVPGGRPAPRPPAG